MKYFLPFLILLFSISVLSQECPQIKVTGPPVVKQYGEDVKFYVTVTPDRPGLRYRWEVSGGNIKRFERPDQIEVEVTKKDGGQSISAVVDVEGLPKKCRTKASDSAAVTEYREPHPYKEFGETDDNDIRAKVDEVFINLEQNGPNVAAIFVSKGPVDSVDLLFKLIRNHIKFRGYSNRERIRFRFKGYQQEIETRVFFVFTDKPEEDQLPEPRDKCPTFQIRRTMAGNHRSGLERFEFYEPSRFSPHKMEFEWKIQGGQVLKRESKNRVLVKWDDLEYTRVLSLEVTNPKKCKNQFNRVEQLKRPQARLFTEIRSLDKNALSALMSDVLGYVTSRPDSSFIVSVPKTLSEGSLKEFEKKIRNSGHSDRIKIVPNGKLSRSGLRVWIVPRGALVDNVY